MPSTPLFRNVCPPKMLKLLVTTALCTSALAGCGGGGGGSSDSVTAIADAPIIALQPEAPSAAFGAGAVFRVIATGTGLSYQWQFSKDGGATWLDIANAIAAIYQLSLVDLSWDGYLYRAVVSSATTTVTTAPAKLTVAPAPLQSRLGGAAYFQPQLNATVLTDANLPASLPLGVAGINADGTMPWPAAKAWVAALNAANYLGFNDWRMPKVGPINGSSLVLNPLVGDAYPTYSGRIDLNYNITAPGTLYSGQPATELPFLFYNALRSIGKYSIAGTAQSSTANTHAPLSHVVAGNYWTGQPYGSDGAYAFDMQNGNQNAYVATTAGGWRFNVMVLRSGDSGL